MSRSLVDAWLSTVEPGNAGDGPHNEVAGRSIVEMEKPGLFERRPRRKTRPDRYELREKTHRSRNTRVAKPIVQSSRTKGKSAVTRTRAGRTDETPFQSFAHRDATHDRLTVSLFIDKLVCLNI